MQNSTVEKLALLLEDVNPKQKERPKSAQNEGKTKQTSKQKTDLKLMGNFPAGHTE